MKKYKVHVPHIFSEMLDIEADDITQARQKAVLEIQKDNRSAIPEYESTVPAEHWAIITEEQYNKILTDFNKQSVNK